MKEHTLVFSGKAFIGLSVALVAGGALLFGVGLFVGIAITEAPGKTSGTALPVTLASADTPTPSDDATAWPFGVAAPAGAPPAAADSAAPTKPAPTDAQPERRRADPDASDADVSVPAPRPSATRSAFQTVAYVAPSRAATASDDATPYIVQAGAFRSEHNAQSLAARLTADGYKPTVVERDDENGRTLHVVRLARIIGRDRAVHVAEMIGDAERLVASVTPDRGN